MTGLQPPVTDGCAWRGILELQTNQCSRRKFYREIRSNDRISVAVVTRFGKDFIEMYSDIIPYSGYSFAEVKKRRLLVLWIVIRVVDNHLLNIVAIGFRETVSCVLLN